MRRIKKIAAMLISFMLFIPQGAFAQDNLSYMDFQKLMTYASLLYIDEDVSPDELIKGAWQKAADENPQLVIELLKAGFSSLDEYSEFYTSEEFDAYMNNINHIFYGIGVSIQKIDGYVEIIECLEDGSAGAAGMAAGDRIIKVDGVDVIGKSVSNLQEMLTGEIDTDVEVTVLRGEREITFNLKRKPISSITVRYGVLEGNIGYIQVVNFAEKTDAEFAKALEELDKTNVKSIVLDLRNNPGGYLISAVNVAKLIVPEGIIVQTMYRTEDKNEVFYSELENPKYNFAVLVNQNTASSAEILAGAIQDSGVGVLVGETTYGKAVIQEMYRLEAGGFKLTTGHYLTRNGNEINKVGIEPEEYVLNTTQRVDMSKYTPFDYKIKWKAGEESESVRAAKERLRGLGYYTGDVDNIFDEELEKAVYVFQADMGLYPYGVLDISTQVRIENEFYKTEEVVDRQFERAYSLLGGNLAEN